MHICTYIRIFIVFEQIYVYVSLSLIGFNCMHIRIYLRLSESFANTLDAYMYMLVFVRFEYVDL